VADASSVALAPRDDGRDLAAVAAFAALAAVAFAGLVAVLDSRLAAAPDSRLAAAVLVARFAWADPLADFAAPAGFAARAAEAFLAGVLVAVRFTGSSVAGRAFVAATYTLSILQIPMGTVVHHRKASALSNIGG
jgi:hypothetical protein